MFVRTKKHPGSKNNSVLICYSVRKNGRIQQKVLCHLGIAHSPDELKVLKTKAEEQLKELRTKRKEVKEDLVNVMPTLLMHPRELSRQNVGVSDILGSLYDSLGFSNILVGKSSKTLKSVILGRFMEPSSKRKTSLLLERRFGDSVSFDAIYRMMDVLGENLRKSSEIVFNATRQATGGKIDLVLFDVTTLHFETVKEDELRAFGFSKNFRFNTTQVVLALATTQDGLPIGYRLFSGNTAEASTLIECVNLWKREISIGKVIMVGDRAMMSKENLEQLEKVDMQYIVAYPMRKASTEMKDKILSGAHYKLDMIQDEVYWGQEIEIQEGQRLIVTHNEKREARDKKEREKLLERVKKKLGKTKNAKRLISNQGYLKYTTINNECVAELNENKIAEDAKWDGLHGIITNTDLSARDVVERYKKLWIIEESFRINKHNLKMRPIYHYTPRRIVTHIEICFLTFALARHAENRLKKGGCFISLERLREELTSIDASILSDETSGKIYRMPSYMTEQARQIYKIFGREKDLQIQELEAIPAY